MSKVLIVDDDEIYRRQLQIALRPDGHEIKVASNGRQAIALVTDWMLKNHVHGLHVARALRAVTPQVRALLVTGFASNHLRAEANQTQVDDFIEKPFGLERLRSAVRGAGLRRKTAPGQCTLAVMEVDGEGSIVFRNAGARELLAETRAGQEAASLAEVFSVQDMPDLDQAVEHFRRALRESGVKPVRVPARGPDLNSPLERCVRTMADFRGSGLMPWPNMGGKILHNSKLLKALTYG